MAYQQAPLGFTYGNQPWFAAPTDEPVQEPKSGDASVVQSPDNLNGRTDDPQNRTSYFSHSHEFRHPHTDRLAKFFTSRFQLHKILFNHFCHWLLNVALLLLIFAALIIYQNKGNTYTDQKHWFNSIITGLQVALALSFFSSLKGHAKLLRWRVLARNAHSMREVDLILSGDSLMKLAGLWTHHARDIISEMWRRTGLQAAFRGSRLYHWLSPSLKYIPSTPRSTSSFARLREGPVVEKSILGAILSLCKINAWIFINVIAQVAIAMIGLTYGVQSGVPIVPAPYAESGAWQPDLSHFYPMNFKNTPPSSWNSEEAAAHFLGDLGTVMSEIDVSDPEDPLTYQLQGAQAYYFVNDNVNAPYYMYRYYSYDQENYFNTTWSVPTNRTVSATWANCEEMAITGGGDGNSFNITFTWPDGSPGEFGLDLIGPGVTTYIYPNDQDSVCLTPSPRCSRMVAVQERSGNDIPFVAVCEITVSEVTNASPRLPQQQLQNAQARNASSAVGLTGYGTYFDRFLSNNKPTLWQFQRYTNDSYWTLAGDSGAEAGQKMAEFAMSALAGMANFNPRLSMPGPIPSIGVLLTVEWQWVRILLPGIAAAHLALFLLVVFLTSPYVVRDDSNLANALLLRPVIERVGPPGKGGCLDGKEIAEILDEEVLDGRRVVYSAIKTRDSMAGVSGSGAAMGGDQYRLVMSPVDHSQRPGSISSLSLRSGWHRDGVYE